MTTASIVNAYAQEFADTVRHLAQQGDSRMRAHVYEVPLRGQYYNFERLGQTTAVNKKTGNRQATPLTDSAAWSRRRVAPDTYNWARTLEHSDRVQMIVDPQSAYAQNGGMAMKRTWDDVIVRAATGDAEDGAGASVTFPAGNIVNGLTTGGLDFANNPVAAITEVNKKFQEADIDPDEPKCAAVSPHAVSVMLNNDKITSADYQAVKMLSANGMVQNFLGFTWVMSNRLLGGVAGGVAANQRRLLFFTRRGIGLAVNQDIFVRISERTDLSHAIQVYLEFTGNATRVEDEHVYTMTIDEANASRAPIT